MFPTPECEWFFFVFALLFSQSFVRSFVFIILRTLFWCCGCWFCFGCSLFFFSRRLSVCMSCEHSDYGWILTKKHQNTEKKNINRTGERRRRQKKTQCFAEIEEIDSYGARGLLCVCHAYNSYIYRATRSCVV